MMAAMARPTVWGSALLTVAVLLLAACGGGRQGRRAPRRRARRAAPSRARTFPAGGRIPTRFTCRGAGDRPALRFGGVPSGAAELALLVIDPDAGGFVHWTVYGMAPGTRGIAATGLPAGGAPGPDLRRAAPAGRRRARRAGPTATSSSSTGCGRRRSSRPAPTRRRSSTRSARPPRAAARSSGASGAADRQARSAGSAQRSSIRPTRHTSDRGAQVTTNSADDRVADGVEVDARGRAPRCRRAARGGRRAPRRPRSPPIPSATTTESPVTVRVVVELAHRVGERPAVGEVHERAVDRVEQGHPGGEQDRQRQRPRTTAARRPPRRPRGTAARPRSPCRSPSPNSTPSGYICHEPRDRPRHPAENAARGPAGRRARGELLAPCSAPRRLARTARTIPTSTLRFTAAISSRNVPGDRRADARP